jgi:hypothetical protein
VAGTWYLGILKGGNTDLGAEVIKQIVSTEHEEQRLYERAGAPVSTAFYKEQYDPKSRETVLPYYLAMNKVYDREQQPQRSKIIFPFHRTQIKDYLSVSDVLYDLIRQVMREQIGDEGNLAKVTGIDALRKKISPHVATTIQRLKRIHSIET